ncbi:UBX domain-containing protein 4-like [Limulus polyphemus]|uniref:UBX domain-containing protein 4 n=1 Tax=Limulus polyphemus TaxID=6850 RepID=A0ABM1SIT8_LIMPO|nr:UBX domain-containing protein 4-like [Limulus polyphemus]XP_022243543.1 UBX domain-containing protein 4-like [Limulus polyphemus]
MKWFEGTIPEAISEAKTRKKVFLVYIEDDDEISKKMAETYNNSEVSQKLEACGCIALKLKAKSEPCKQFSQIYPVVIIPSSFFIGPNGVPLEVVAGNPEPQEFLTKIDKMLELHQSNLEKLPDSGTRDKTTSPSSSQSSSVDFQTPTNQVPAATIPSDETTTCASEITQATTSKKARYDKVDEAEDDLSESSVEDKVKRARKLLEEKKIQKEKEQQEKEKIEEVERRKLGKELQKFRQQKQDQEVKELAQERAREKEEERLARERVKAQIEQDRAERAIRFEKAKANELRQRQLQEERKLKAEQERAATEAAANSQFARIQFRLPDGSSVTNQFLADAPLERLHQFVQESVRPPFSSFVLSTTFPRRQFKKEDFPKPLRDLQLVPTAVVLVLPEQAVIPSDRGSGIVSYLWFLISPVLVLWRIISNFLFGSGASSSATPSTIDAQTNSSPSSSQDATNLRNRKSDSSSFTYREGNIYRLNNQQNDSDDDNNTWNGNSTQQM